MCQSMTALTTLSGSNPKPKPYNEVLHPDVCVPEHDSPDSTVRVQP